MLLSSITWAPEARNEAATSSNARSFAGATLPLAIFALQLVLNAAWTPLFFGLHHPDLAFLEIMVLWASILATIALFYPIHSGAALLLVPYPAWVSFAAALNFAVWRLNPSA